jgi:hypothetical protein
MARSIRILKRAEHAVRGDSNYVVLGGASNASGDCRGNVLPSCEAALLDRGFNTTRQGTGRYPQSQGQGTLRVGQVMPLALYTFGLACPAAGIALWLATDHGAWLILCIPVVLFLS